MLHKLQQTSEKTPLEKNCLREASFNSYHAEEDVKEKKSVIGEEHLSAPSSVDSVACSVLMQHATVRHKEIMSRWKSFPLKGGDREDSIILANGAVECMKKSHQFKTFSEAVTHPENPVERLPRPTETSQRHEERYLTVDQN